MTTFQVYMIILPQRLNSINIFICSFLFWQKESKRNFYNCDTEDKDKIMNDSVCLNSKYLHK